MENFNDDKWITQMKKGVYELAILLLVSKQDMYGYEINNALNNLPSVSLAAGSIYPILKRMVNKNWISFYWVDSEDGPRRKYYKITEEGESVAQKRISEYEELFDSLQSLRGGLYE
ncbi:hypothetical conserved protein [Oceanobacillus iheyensis HTE831]|uniref:Hypothetical conserved protein n=1 Tax=Oceanobacillus iheyensis (strain DSM 14371 / CIP 107618 / JCM 11309 / KCTC 3954 / HTE831) TaxID=221109 RepID=Q8CV09_OCEIH|nr:PadR family transcriptional regulator [Oceanobacillus iheyensis]BAC12904.1 hypothetical conserved protein [Oceanobacillus iheyensis HTE831]